ncbi:CDP-alcohol phosphatidyltransferase family protein [Arachidicoccus sp.]|jgi:CDP-diacylglycerol--serine O-phosphatidyltransferase|uniref:CDP-alcohol phosphatidyltransferase family protein n=1 Tax=Arachidicoccus sp. TaxID=1872624 RepID=UPI003D245557
MRKHIANCFTLLNLVFGCLAVIYILDGFGNASLNNMYFASIFICCAAVVDFLDGLIARLLNAASELGKQLDSLADLVSFGVAPGLIIFQFLKISIARNHPEFAENIWRLLPALLVPCAGAFRLARFNLSKSKSLNFEGMPIPAAGIFVASLPVIYSFNHFDFVETLLQNGVFWYGVIFVVSFLMISTLPMMSMKFKNLAFKQNWPKFLLVVITVLLVISLKWLAVPIVFLLYVLLSLITLSKEK